MDQPAVRGILSGRGRLIVLSFLMLFVELALIRWTGSNVIYLSYFSNFVLLGSFLGIGIGFLRGRSSANFFDYAIVLLGIFVALILLFPVTINRSSEDLIFFGPRGTTGLPIWFVLPSIFLTVAAIMACIAQEVARSFAAFEPLEAYRLDILGSLAGIVLFSLLSFSGAPPVAWGSIATAAFLLLYAPNIKLVHVAACLVLVVGLAKESAYPEYTWTPYYKIRLFSVRPGLTSIVANGIPHQIIMAAKEYDPATALYFDPYLMRATKRFDRVLIVGAGNGIDTAIALQHGAKSVDAVEIDPGIYRIGRRLNPDHPYQDPRVHVHIDDGRAFLQRDAGKYDLVLFALPDSLTLVSGQSSLRLESYLFTREAIASARAHLGSGGIFAMYNLYRERWLIDRLARTLDEVFGHPPCLDLRVEHTAVLAAGLLPSDTSCKTLWQPNQNTAPAPVDDNRPFLYLKTPSIPELYLVALALIACVSLVAVRVAGGPPRLMLPYADLFFMGAAFLLLETKSVVQFALLFGSTWFINALVFFGVLVAVYAAIEVARRRPIRRPGVAYGALFVWLAVAWAIEPSRLLELDAPLRLAAAIALSFGPIFLANVIFADRFRAVASSTAAFGTNLLGAMLGGILEYSSLIFGYRDLLIVVAALYALAFALTTRETETAKDPSWAR